MATSKVKRPSIYTSRYCIYSWLVLLGFDLWARLRAIKTSKVGHQNGIILLLVPKTDKINQAEIILSARI